MNCTGLGKQGNLKLLNLQWSLPQNKASKSGTFFGTPGSLSGFLLSVVKLSKKNSRTVQANLESRKAEGKMLLKESEAGE